MKNIYLILILFVSSISGAQIITFQDGNLKYRLLQAANSNHIAKDINGDAMAVDTNENGEIEVSEALQVYWLDVSNSVISQYDGLEFFTNLRFLNCKFNLATNINLSTFANLEELDANPTQLWSIDVTALTNLKKLSVYAPTISNVDLSNNPLLENITLGGGGLTSLDLSNQTELDSLNVSSNQLALLDLSNNLQLRSVRCSSNQLSSLDVSMLTNLRALHVNNNNLTAINVAPLINLLTLEVSGNLLGTIDVSTLVNLQTLAAANCGITFLDLSNNPELRHLFADNNLLTSVDISSNPLLLSCTIGQNQIASMDFSNSPELYWIDCSNNQMLTLDVSMLPQLQTFDCSGNTLLTLDVSENPLLCLFEASNNPQLQSIFMKNGDAGCPMEFILNNNPTLQYVCTDDAEVAYFTGYFGSGVAVSSYCSFSPGGDHNTVTGTVRYDFDGSGCDASDFAVSFLKIDVTGTDGSGSVYTDQNGNYTVHTTDDNVTLHPNFENSNYFVMFLPVAINFPALNTTINQDFCVVPNGIHPDLEVVVAPVVVARPGFAAVYKILYKNKGNQVMSQPLGVSFGFDDSKMDFVSADVAPNQQTAGQLAWSFANLLPFESRSIEIIMQINAPTHPTDPVNVGDGLLFTAAIQPLAGDDMPADNAFELPQTVIGSYDPNNLICLEGDVVSTAMIGQYLHYIANFENTGTDAAVNIVVKTVFDPAKVDVNSLRILGSSDPVQIRVNGNTAEYVFQDINLAIGGHGNILLKIKSNNSLTNGDAVLNKADIFFDYNLPITTNDAVTTFQMLSVGDLQQDNSIAVYPNPSGGVVNISAAQHIQSVQLYDVQGRLLQTKLCNEPFAAMDISERQSGIYFVKVVSTNGTAVRKVVKK